jgi:predicted nuclease of restriction endonuclease-like (RecB) superfamily
MKGFSITNIKYMRKWYLFWHDEKSPQLVDEIFSIPWGHNREIVTKAKTRDEALFYVRETIQNNYSRVVLLHQIESGLYEREGKAISNFDAKLPAPQSDLAQAILKDPYNFDFLMLTQKHDERELEDALIEQISSFLLELGSGFAFIGRQYKLVVGGDEFRVDLLFYHVKLKCYIVVELKTVKFKPEFAGQLNFYVSAIDGELREADDNPTLGILICKSKNDTVVEYALKKIDNPIGVSEYQLVNQLPKEFKSSLPSIEEIEEELRGVEV